MRKLFRVTLSLLLLNQVKAFTQADSYTFLIIGPFTMIASLTIIIIFICLPETRKTPGDILLGLSICDFIQTLNYLFSGATYQPYENFFKLDISRNDITFESYPFCVINGMLTTLFTIGSYLYNMAFVLTPLLLVQNNLTNKFPYVNLLMHISIISCIIIALLIGLLDKRMIFIKTSGFCANMGLDYVIAYVVLLLVYFVAAWKVIHQFHCLLKLNAEIKESVKEYMFIYRRFTYTTALLWFLQLMFIILLNGKPTIGQNIFNVITITTPIIQCVIRLQDPILRTQIKKTRLYRMCYPNDQSIVTKTHSASLEFLSDRSDLSLHGHVQVPDIINDIQQSVRTTWIYSMLSGILMMNKQKSQLVLEMVEGIGLFSKKDEDNRSELLINNEGVQNTFPGNHEFSVFKINIILYSPTIFQYLGQTDNKLVNFEESLNLFKSKDSILTCSIPSGGKSGEFFFFSWDNKLIIKTMNLSEVLTFRKRSKTYGNYLVDHPDSMISKIYGIYTLQRLIRDSVESTIHIMVMRNISIGVPRRHILRTFDMKGSEYDREVLNKNLQQDPSKITLKDLDFFKTEQKVFVQPELSKQLLIALQEDADFLKNCKLMDYSLLVMKIDWQSYINDTGPLTQFVRKQITNPLQMIESCKEKGIFYHIAIIDYLQEWNINKSAEQVAKKIIKFDHKLDTSAQNPKVYAERFKSKLLERILMLTKEGKSETMLELSSEIQ